MILFVYCKISRGFSDPFKLKRWNFDETPFGHRWSIMWLAGPLRIVPLPSIGGYRAAFTRYWAWGSGCTVLLQCRTGENKIIVQGFRLCYLSHRRRVTICRQVAGGRRPTFVRICSYLQSTLIGSHIEALKEFTVDPCFAFVSRYYVLPLLQKWPDEPWSII